MEVGNHLTEKGKKDLELVHLAQQGDQAAFAELMGKYRDSIYFMVNKMVRNTDDAEDLTIEAFGKAFLRINQYSPDYAFSTWLFKIASNNCIDFIRKKRLQMTSMDTRYESEDGEYNSMQVRAEDLDPEEEAIKNQKIKMMRLIVEKLKPHYRILVEKRYFEELSYEEIAEQMDLPLGTVKAQLFRAREFLANMMEKTRDSI
jgi:RNA polymerase sigma-70 factor (ECF subfamily)